MAALANRSVMGTIAAGRDGYLVVAADGGIFSFGTAPLFGSLGDRPLISPVVAVSSFIG